MFFLFHRFFFKAYYGLSFIYKFGVLVVMCWAGLAHAVDIPYEQCDWKNKEWTEQLVQESENFLTEADCPTATCNTNGKDTAYTQNADNSTTIQPTQEALKIPPACFLVSAVHSVAKPPGQIKDEEGNYYANYYYCDSRDDKKTKRKFTIENPEGKKTAINPRPPCLNKDYIMMTYHAFHNMADCFKFSPEEKKSLFTLFNHESHFILNQKSHTGARCYGQLTSVAFTEINKRIYVSDQSDRFESSLYKEFKENCPDLLDRVLIPDKIRNGITDNSWQKGRYKKGPLKGHKYKGKFDSFDDNYNQVRTAAQNMSCPLTRDANTCFFYAMYNMKINQKAQETALGQNAFSFLHMVGFGYRNTQN